MSLLLSYIATVRSYDYAIALSRAARSSNPHCSCISRYWPQASQAQACLAYPAGSTLGQLTQRPEQPQKQRQQHGHCNNLIAKNLRVGKKRRTIAAALLMFDTV